MRLNTTTKDKSILSVSSEFEWKSKLYVQKIIRSMEKE